MAEKVRTARELKEKKYMATLELDEKTAKMLAEDRKISDAFDKRKSDLVIEKKELIEKQNMITKRLIEIGIELEEYKEEY